MDELKIERLHAADGDHDDLGWYSKGHHGEAAFRAALDETFWYTDPRDGQRKRDKHPCEADETRCEFVQTWWRVVGGNRFHSAVPNSRGAFKVTAMLVPEAEF